MFVHVCIHLRVPHVTVYPWVGMESYLHACIHACIHACTHAHIHTHTYIATYLLYTTRHLGIRCGFMTRTSNLKSTGSSCCPFGTSATSPSCPGPRSWWPPAARGATSGCVGQAHGFCHQPENIRGFEWRCVGVLTFRMGLPRSLSFWPDLQSCLHGQREIFRKTMERLQPLGLHPLGGSSFDWRVVKAN